jgi:hypothetical protein
MPGDAIVMESGIEWATASEVQQRFMQHLGETIETLS